MLRKSRKKLQARFARVKLLLCDVDGILTDGTVSVGGRMETKRFHIRDGLGLLILKRQGIKVGWISNRPSPATALRAEELKIDFLHQENGRKVDAIEAILEQTGLNWGEICFIGDDVVDLGALKRAGLAVTVPDANREARATAHYITHAHGGSGAVREVVEMILKAQKKWSRVIKEYSA